MNKKLRYSLLLLLFPVLLLAQEGEYRSSANPYYWKNRKPYEGYWQQDVHYRIKAGIDDKTDIVNGEEELTYYNNSPDTLRVLYFHLYQNAFIKGAYLENLNLANNFKQKFGKYEANGKGTEIVQLEVADAQGNFQNDWHGHAGPAKQYVDNGSGEVKPLFEIDYSIMKVNLAQPLMPNASVKIRIVFKTYFDDGGNQRRRMKTFKDAWGNKQYDGVHWYPRICVYDRKFGWETDQHLGKEFYGDYGTFEVDLTLPNNYVLDATGALQNRSEVLPQELRAKLDVKNFKDKPWDSAPSEITKADGSNKTWKFRAINVHDFAWTADPTYRIGEETITLSNGQTVSCISLSQEPHSGKWQDAAGFCARVIRTYSRDIGNYAYPKMIVADARDGMEYPMLTLDGGSSPGYYGLIAHEVGHNWFFGIVGNNETYRASLDEGFTQFLTNWSMTSILGENKPTKKNPKPVSRMDQTNYWGYLRDAINHNDVPLNTHSDDFNGALNHGGGYGHVYYKTATMLYNLQYVLGDTLFLASMQHYFDQWKMCHPYFEDFRSSIINYSHVDLNWFFDQWLETTKRIDYKIVKVKKLERTQGGTDLYGITFKRKGDMQMPVDFTVRTKDTSYNYIVPNTYFAKKSNATVLPVWRGWGILNPTYTAQVQLPAGSRISYVQIDTTYRLADVYQLDNSTRCPIDFRFDNGRMKPVNRKYYQMQWRPDVWYNSVDGVKAGLHLDGNYLRYNHIFSLTAWYNTTLGKDYGGTARNYVNYNFTYRNGIGKDLHVDVASRFLDGLWLHRLGLEKQVGKNTFSLYLKSLYRDRADDLDYLLYPAFWNAGRWNNTINLDMERSYGYSFGTGNIKLGLRSSTLFSDYDYARVFLQVVNYNNLGKLEWRTRAYAQWMTGSNIAPESQLFLSGMNPEEMMENKFLRSRGFVPVNWLGYGNDYNHFHAAGGLNVRGFAGYAVPKNVEASQVYLFTGRNGASANIELDFDRFIPIAPKGVSRYIHFDTYLFADAGIIQQQYEAGASGLSKKQYVNSDILVSAGAGAALTIKRWLNLDEAKPLTLRFDMPFFLNHTPYVDGTYTKFRWVVGLSRAF